MQGWFGIWIFQVLGIFSLYLLLPTTSYNSSNSYEVNNLKVNEAWVCHQISIWICHQSSIVLLDTRLPSSCWWAPTASKLTRALFWLPLLFLNIVLLSYRFIISWSCLPTGPMWKMLAECKNMRILSQRRNKSCMIFILLALKSGSMLIHKRNLVVLPNMWMLCCLTKGHPTI